VRSILPPRSQIDHSAYNTTDHNGCDADDRSGHNVGQQLRLLRTIRPRFAPTA
jgi:hypothetical protein